MIAKGEAGSDRLLATTASALYKLLAYKDEYEVARLFSDGRFERALKDNFDGNLKLEFHLAPPVLAGDHRESRADAAHGSPGAW